MSDPKDIHQVEQMVAGLVKMAAAMRRYYEALVKEGFTENEAFEMTWRYQIAIARGRSSDDG